MSISNALSNATSGLSAMSRTAETISNNVANALTEGYSRQEVEYKAQVLGGNGVGVRVDSVNRSVDFRLTSTRQRAEAAMSNTTVIASTQVQLANLMGQPENPQALANQIVSLETALRDAISAPESISHQNNVLSSAKNLTDSFNSISTETSRIRLSADAKIAQEVKVVNSSLRQIEKLNAEIRLLSLSGRGAASLEDQRQSLIDTVNSIIPIRQSTVEKGEVALFSTGGSVLLLGSPATLEFTPSSLVTPDMTLASGALSGLSLDGKLVSLGQGLGSLDGGSLAANFQVRDTLAPKFQSQIDALARDLIERFQNPASDPSLAPGDAGLFTDSGGPFTAANESGVSGRITVNAAVDPSSGGALWRIRDGINAAAPGLVGNSTQLERLSDSLVTITTAGVNIGTSADMNSSGFTQSITSFWMNEAATSENIAAQSSGFYAEIRMEELNSVGVNSDNEMQALLVVEQMYSANARVLSVIDSLMKTLLEM